MVKLLHKLKAPEDLIAFLQEVCKSCRTDLSHDGVVASVNWRSPKYARIKYELLLYPGTEGTDFSLHIKVPGINDLRRIIKAIETNYSR